LRILTFWNLKHATLWEFTSIWNSIKNNFHFSKIDCDNIKWIRLTTVNYVNKSVKTRPVVNCCVYIATGRLIGPFRASWLARYSREFDRWWNSLKTDSSNLPEATKTRGKDNRRGFNTFIPIIYSISAENLKLFSIEL